MLRAHGESGREEHKFQSQPALPLTNTVIIVTQPYLYIRWLWELSQDTYLKSKNITWWWCYIIHWYYHHHYYSQKFLFIISLCFSLPATPPQCPFHLMHLTKTPMHLSRFLSPPPQSYFWSFIPWSILPRALGIHFSFGITVLCSHVCLPIKLWATSKQGPPSYYLRFPSGQHIVMRHKYVLNECPSPVLGYGISKMGLYLVIFVFLCS